MQSSKKYYHSKNPEEFRKYLASRNKTDNKNKTVLIIFLDILLIVLVLFFTNQYLLEPKKSSRTEFVDFTAYVNKKSNLNYFLFFQNDSPNDFSFSNFSLKPFLEVYKKDRVCFSKKITFSDFSLGLNEKKAILISLEENAQQIEESCNLGENVNTWFSFSKNKLQLIFKLDYENKTYFIFEDFL